MNNDTIILRSLAHEYFKISHDVKNAENLKLHTAVNDLKQIRPVVLIDELPWHEMNINDELTLRCTNPFLREIECFFRRNIYKFKYFPADLVLRPYLPISKVVNSSGMGIDVQEKTLSTDANNHIVSHEYTDLLKTQEDLEKLHIPKLTYDRSETMRKYNRLGEILGDILPVKITGVDYFSVTTWDNIATYRGVTNLLMDLTDRPDFMHRIVQKLTDIKISELEQMEELNVFENDPYLLHCTPLHTSDLPGKSYDGEHMTRKDVWGRGAAQIFASVSNKMHEEFDIEYMSKTIGQCGLVYYGCCEPLDRKIDIIEKIPNLRKVSITPWADINRAAEAINKKYVLSSKPNPAYVAVPKLDKDNLKNEIKSILDACKRNHCSCDIVLKDISTCGNRPENIFEWEKIVMDMVRNY